METKVPTPLNLTKVTVWQLPRRFDALTWFVRWQRENNSFLDSVHLHIPMVGPSVIEIPQTAPKQIASQLGSTGEVSLGVIDKAWHPHSDYLEPLTHWSARQLNSGALLAQGSITWLLSLHREAWLALAATRLREIDTSLSVKSAWLVLALGSTDADLLAAVPDDAFYTSHSQIYADELTRGIQYLEAHAPKQLYPWLTLLAKRTFFKDLWPRVPVTYRSDLEAEAPQSFKNLLL